MPGWNYWDKIINLQVQIPKTFPSKSCKKKTNTVSNTLSNSAPASESTATSFNIVNGQVLGDNAGPDAIYAAPTVGLFVDYTIASMGCTGVLVANDMLLTAAHCISPEIAGLPGNMTPNVTIFFNSNWASGMSRVPAGSMIKHPNYDVNQHGFDIAIIRFSGGVPAGYAPIGIYYGYADAKGAEARIVGYGITASNNTFSDFGIRRIATSYIDALINLDNGPLFYVSATNPANGQSNHSSSCHGDSGGPVYLIPNDSRPAARVLGLVHSADPNGPDPEHSGCEYGKTLYTPITPYLSWIQQSSGIDLTPKLNSSVSLGNLPDKNSSENTISVKVRGVDEVSQYQYVLQELASPANPDCNNLSLAYSGFIPINTPIAANITTFGTKILCVRGKNSKNEVTPIVTYSWNKPAPSASNATSSASFAPTAVPSPGKTQVPNPASSPTPSSAKAATSAATSTGHESKTSAGNSDLETNANGGDDALDCVD